MLDIADLGVFTPKRTLKAVLYAGLEGWLNLEPVPVTINIINKPVTAKLSTGKITLSSVNSKGTDLQLVAPKGYALQDLGIREVTVDSNDYILGGFDPSTGSFHLSPVIQEGETYANPVPGKINIQVTYANGVTVDLPLTVTTKAPTVKPKKSSFSFLNGVADVQAVAVTVSPADYDLIGLLEDEDGSVAAQEFLVDEKDPAKAATAYGYFERIESASEAAMLGVKAGYPFFSAMGDSNGYVGNVKLTFELPGVKPFTVTVKFTKNTPTMRLKVNGTIDASKTGKVALTTTIQNLTPYMQPAGEAEVTLLDPHGNVVDPGEYVVDVPSFDSPDTLLLYRRPEMSGRLDSGTYTVQVTRKLHSEFSENETILTASAKLKVKNTTPTLKVSKTKVTLNPYDGKGAEIKVTVPKDQYMDYKYLGWMDQEGEFLRNGEDAPLARWVDENTITIDTYNPYTGKPFEIPDGVYYLCVTPDYRDSKAKTTVIPVTVQRKTLKSIKTWKAGSGVNLLDWNSYQDQGFFLPMSQAAAGRADYTVTLQGSDDNKTFVDIDQSVFPNPEAYYPICAEDEWNYFEAGKYEWGTLKEDCAYFGMYAHPQIKDSHWNYKRENTDLYRYYRVRLTVTAEDGGTVFTQTIQLPVRNSALKVTQAKVPTVDRRDLTKPFTAQVKFSEKNVTLAAKIADDAYASEFTPWSSLVRVTNLDKNGNLTLAFQDANAISDVAEGKSATIPVTFYVPYGRKDQTFTANIKVNFK